MRCSSAQMSKGGARTSVCRISDSRDAAWEPLHHASFRKFYRGKRNGIVFLLSLLLLSGVGACVRVWKGVDVVLCGVQVHKCPTGGLEPESVESPILGTWPANHYPMPAFKNFTEGKERSSCCLPTTTPCLTTTPCQLSNFLPRKKKGHRVACQPLPHANFRKFDRGQSKGIVFFLSLLLMSGVGACVRVWKGVDGVLCGVQAHKCPKGGLEPESVESPILGVRPANHYPMPAFEIFTGGKEMASCSLAFVRLGTAQHTIHTFSTHTRPHLTTTRARATLCHRYTLGKHFEMRHGSVVSSPRP